MYPQTWWQSRIMSPRTRSNSAGQGKQLLFQTRRLGFTQEWFPQLNCLHLSLGCYFILFCVNFPGLIGESYQLVVQLVRCSQWSGS